MCVQFHGCLNTMQIMPEDSSPHPATTLVVGALAIKTRAFLAPMSGITDAPCRRLASRLGAGLVISEMTASEALAKGTSETRLRSEAYGGGIHVVQLAGCEARWM